MLPCCSVCAFLQYISFFQVNSILGRTDRTQMSRWVTNTKVGGLPVSSEQKYNFLFLGGAHIGHSETLDQKPNINNGQLQFTDSSVLNHLQL